VVAVVGRGHCSRSRQVGDDLARPGEDVELDGPRRPSPSRRASPEMQAFREPRARDLGLRSLERA
jgi:hypothetical protein